MANIFDRSLPHADDMEKLILGAIILDNGVMAQVVESLKASDFYSPTHRRVYAAMVELFKSNTPIEVGLIAEQMTKNGDSIESIGGQSAIAQLAFGLPYYSDLAEYIKVVRDKSIKRQMIMVCDITMRNAMADEEMATEIIDTHEQLVYDLRMSDHSKGFAHISDAAKAVVERQQDILNRNLQITGIPTGFTELDELLDGLVKKDLLIIAGRTSMGKTSFALSLTQNVTRPEYGNQVAFFSLEMSKEELARRVMLSEARLSTHQFKRGFYGQDGLARLQAVINELPHRGIHIDESPALTPLEIKARARRLRAKQKRLDLVVIDHIQLMRYHVKTESTRIEIKKISNDLKAMAKELEVPVIALSQLSRAPETRKPPKPMLSDLRESGAIEEDADAVMFVYRPDYYHETEENRGIAEIIVAKNRNGPTGSVKLAFLKEFTRFENTFVDRI